MNNQSQPGEAVETKTFHLVPHDPDNVIIVSKHLGIQEFAVQQGLANNNCQKATWIDPYDATGKHIVCQSVPMEVAAFAESVTEIKLRRQDFRDRKQNLNLRDVNELYEGTRRYQVFDVTEVTEDSLKKLEETASKKRTRK